MVVRKPAVPPSGSESELSDQAPRAAVPECVPRGVVLPDR
ncbi:hypothetical protein MPS_1174 [Mycobacterium pseudoshottsii JCM 15466]|nr:hypothetical protein MPS_1174 [Mycobacterium pseudoshottsii JCM 15466]